MSRYVPSPETLHVEQREDGWWVYDAYGPYAGPYAKADAYAAMWQMQCEED